MKINDKIITALLYEEEGVTIDFKKEQYPFKRASDDEKSELLKDILAFANAWRRTTAYILVGVEEIKSGKSRVVGITELIDDASIQQFVNKKTQRPITFSCSNHKIEGKQIAIIQIPCQKRPFYLKKDYGKLKKNTVYIRRGSSTDLAEIDEIAQMGNIDIPKAEAPKLDVFFANPSTREKIKTNPEINSLALDTSGIGSIPDYYPNRSTNHAFDSLNKLSLLNINREYYRDLVKFTKIHRLVSPLFIAISNNSSVTAHDVRMEIHLPSPDDSVSVMDNHDYPNVPKSHSDSFYLATMHTSPTSKSYDLEASKIGDKWVIEGRADKVQAKATHWFQDPFFVGSFISQTIEVQITSFADNLEYPHRQSLTIQFKSRTREANLDIIFELESERYRSSQEYKNMTKKKKLRKNSK